MGVLSVDTAAHAATSAATFVLLGKLYLTIAAQGGARFKAGSRPPEDAKLSLTKTMGAAKIPQTFGLATSAPADASVDAVKQEKYKMNDLRWQRIVMNDLENIPIGLIIAWSSLLSAYSPKAHSVLVISFAAFRIFHTYSYAKALQPHRAIGWIGGITTASLMALNGLVGVLAKL
ncbi:hypothetical protein HDU78_007425 [Chytriomyces hyalinus]|nr:hypothetical protein HDU78_007425 [Chytriomyces hyalinus]KAJ3262867.1 hypothetical protein HDU77_011728 [Chytriomyces hyalinus]